MRTRDEMYFEPRVVTESGTIRWYGYTYKSDALMQHTETTVYVRDQVKEILIYVLKEKELTDTKLEYIGSIEKKDQKSCYGNYFGKRDTQTEKEILANIEQCKIDLDTTESPKRKRDLNKYMKRLNKELKRIRRRVA